WRSYVWGTVVRYGRLVWWRTVWGDGVRKWRATVGVRCEEWRCLSSQVDDVVVVSSESPLQFYVNNANSANVTASGPGLVYGVANKTAMFTIYTEDAAEGGLDLAIEGPSKADITCVDNKDGTCTVTYLPVLPGDYHILVRYNDKHIAGSPFNARITGKRHTQR
ncbi:unnamed protein product, partial [Oncorhynchus mykiss]